MIKPATPRWNAVSIICATGSCDAARALKGKRFLSTAAPRLPLSECSVPGVCLCVYKKYPDRRTGARREEDKTGLRRPVTGESERRNKRGRRNTDE